MKYVITITTDDPDGDAIVREGTRMIAEQLGWGDDNTTSIEAVEADIDPPRYLAGYEMEPGS